MKLSPLTLTCLVLASLPSQSALGQTAQAPRPASGSATNLPAAETPPILKASEVLQASILQGPYHKVSETVPTSGFLNHYTIESNFGVFNVKGNALLAKRVHEINAMAALGKIEKSDEFKKALANTAKMPLHMVENLIDDPKGTVKQVGEGAKRFVHRAGEIFQRNGNKTKEEDNALQSALGFSKAKRKICWDLKVDPYSDNQALQQKLDDLAWTTFAGEFTVKLGMLAIPGGTGTAISGVSTSSTIAESIRDNSPVDLSAQNREILASMGISESLTDAFLGTRDLSPTHQTVIVRQLADIKNARGKDAYISMCLSARSEADAVFFQRITQLMLTYNQQQSPILSIFNLYGLPAAYTQDQSLVIPLELDYGSWSADAHKLAAAIASYQLPGREIKQRKIIITGKLSPTARQGLTASGLQVIENASPEGVYRQAPPEKQ